MSAPKILIAAAVAAILSSLAYALPRHIRSTDIQENNNNRSLKDVLNNTVCPIMVDYDIDENRVPRRIKVLKCAAQPGHCSRTSRNDKSHECCTHKDDNQYLECVEVLDKIYVTFKAKPEELIEKEVPVGCSCMIQKITEAKSTPDVINEP